MGIGTLKEEFDILGVPFDHRGERADDSMKALRASLSQPEPSYHGAFQSFEGLVIDPCAVQDRVPLWVGGQSLASLQRAASFGDGWCPFSVSATQAAAWLAGMDSATFDVVLPPVGLLDPLGEPERAGEILAETAACGATIVNAAFRHESLAHYLENLEALMGVKHALGV